MANIYTDIKLFDAEYYLANNPDVAEAIEGTDVTAQDHYFLHGAAENRAPNSWFNAAEYVAQNPDLAGVDANLLLAHFALHGVNEGRAPNAATAGADGKIKPELLADYVNAEGNEDVKDAIAEITGAPVGAELTAEQAAIAAQHFFNFGIDEGREGGIADEISGDDTGIEAVVEALEAYQAELTAQEAAVKAEKEVIKSAAEHDNVTLATDADAAAAKTAVEKAVKDAGGKVLDASDETITGEVSDTKIANAEKVLQAKVDAAKAAVAEEAANAPKVVAIQEQLKAQDAAVKAANKVNKAYVGELAKFTELNDEDAAVEAEFKLAQTAGTPVHATLTVGEDKYTVAVVKGKAVVYVGEATGGTAPAPVSPEWKNGVPQTEEGKDLPVATAKQLEKIDGLDAMLNAFVGVYNNDAALAKANAAVEKAIIDALKAEGYKPFDKDAKANEATAWNQVRFDNDGNAFFIKANGNKGEKVYLSFKKLDKDNEFVEGSEVGDSKVRDKPVYTPATQKIDEDAATATATATATGVEDLSKALLLENLSTAIQTAAKNSATAVKTLKDAEEALEGFQEAVETYNELKGLQTELADAAKAVKAAGEAVETAAEVFEDLGVNLVTDVTTDGTVNDEDDEDQPIDLFVYSGVKLDGVANFDGDDLFYFGDKAAKLVKLDADFDVAKGKLNGDADVLEIFAVQNGANTDLYVEKVAFAGNSSNAIDANKDLVKIELVGVNAEDLQFNDGFLMFA